MVHRTISMQQEVAIACEQAVPDLKTAVDEIKAFRYGHAAELIKKVHETLATIHMKGVIKYGALKPLLQKLVPLIEALEDGGLALDPSMIASQTEALIREVDDTGEASLNAADQIDRDRPLFAGQEWHEQIFEGVRSFRDASNGDSD